MGAILYFSTLKKLAKSMCKYIKLATPARLVEAGMPQALVDAMLAVKLACEIWEALDNFPGEIDGTAPTGPEDVAPPQG